MTAATVPAPDKTTPGVVRPACIDSHSLSEPRARTQLPFCRFLPTGAQRQLFGGGVSMVLQFLTQPERAANVVMSGQPKLMCPLRRPAPSAHVAFRCTDYIKCHQFPAICPCTKRRDSASVHAWQTSHVSRDAANIMRNVLEVRASLAHRFCDAAAHGHRVHRARLWHPVVPEWVSHSQGSQHGR